MRIALLVIASFGSGVVTTTWFSSLATAQAQQTVTAEPLRTDLGDWCPGKEVLISVASNGPRTGTRHYHPAHSFSWMIEGSQTVRPDGKAAYEVKAGDVMHEAPFEISETVNANPTKVLIFRILEKGQPVTTNAD